MCRFARTHPRILQRLIERGGEFSVAVMHDNVGWNPVFADVPYKCLGLHLHPRFVGMVSRRGDGR
jgi:hypothetical protein